MALAKKRHIVTTSHRPIKEVHIIGEREVIVLIYNNIIILLYINHNIRSILRIATSLMGRWDNGTTGQKPRPTLEVPKSSPSPPSPPFRPPEGDTIALLVMKPPRGQYGGAFSGDEGGFLGSMGGFGVAFHGAGGLLCSFNNISQFC